MTALIDFAALLAFLGSMVAGVAWRMRRGQMLNEICLACRYCETIENGARGFLGESVFKCRICEEETMDKTLCFALKEDEQ